MSTIIWVVLGIITVVGAGYFVKDIVGVRGRVKTLLIRYRDSKRKHPNAEERYHLEEVVNRMVLPKKAVKLKNSSITAEQYLDYVFEGMELDINKLIYHIITQEFPGKYPAEINMDEIREASETGKKTKSEKLRDLIDKMHKEILS